MIGNLRRGLNSSGRMFYSVNNLKPPWNIHFYGNDDFSLASLKVLNLAEKNLIGKLEVITNGIKNPVGKYAIKNTLRLHKWPILKENIGENVHIGIVVSFGYLIPQEIIESYPLGMINVHGSLLPRWRGASPIVHAIANGDHETGVTIMKIRPKKFDIGEIVRQEAVEIDPDKKMPELYTELAHLGARNLLRTMENLLRDLSEAKEQKSGNLVKLAPKLDPSMAHINFQEMSIKKIYDLGRALTGEFPLLMPFKDQTIKLHSINGYKEEEVKKELGFIQFDKENNVLRVACKNGWIFVDKVQVPRKKVMSAFEFKNGYLK